MYAFEKTTTMNVHRWMLPCFRAWCAVGTVEQSSLPLFEKPSAPVSGVSVGVVRYVLPVGLQTVA
jgi:hypothetical protein